MLDRDTILKLASQGATYSHGNAVAFEDVDMVRFAHAIASLVYEDAVTRCEAVLDESEYSTYSTFNAGIRRCIAAIRQRAGEVKP